LRNWLNRWRKSTAQQEKEQTAASPERAERDKQVEQAEKPERVETPQQAGQVEQPGQAAQAELGEGAGRVGQSERLEQGGAPSVAEPGEQAGQLGQVQQVAQVTVPAQETEVQGQPIELKERRGGLFSRLVQGLTKTRMNLVQKVTHILSGRSAIDEGLYEELEEALIQADVGLPTTERIVAAVRKRVAQEHVRDPQEVENLLKEEMTRILTEPAQPLATPQPDHLLVFLVVGVNGSGKTTTIGKLAYQYRNQGLRVVLGAADTFRAAAIDQLAMWAQRSGAELVRHQEGSDPAAVAFDAVRAAQSRRADVLIIDTAGRLQTKAPLMQELAKIHRVVERELGRKPDEVLLVLDATTGQNGMSQARLFNEAINVTGVVLTKLDGTAKGGIVLAIAAELGLPVKLIGIGEGTNDLREFDAKAFVSALFTREEAYNGNDRNL
jgi:fused signal recognition particle receptor